MEERRREGSLARAKLHYRRVHLGAAWQGPNSSGSLAVVAVQTLHPKGLEGHKFNVESESASDVPRPLSRSVLAG